jgi:23S rRNA (uridine2552-2'-O)-methyltransferase
MQLILALGSTKEMARSKSSASWLSRHLSDPFVKQAQKDGYRSRSAYKLIELNEKDKLIRPGMRILDLGSAPGGWSQVAAKLVGDKGRVLATDILPMDALKGVDFIQGDFTEDAVVAQLLAWLGSGKFDLIISDIAPNITGISSADQASSIYFLELALDTVRKTLKPGASFAAKMFQGSGSDQYLKELRAHFEKVLIRKPAASRKESREVCIWWPRDSKGQNHDFCIRCQRPVCRRCDP